MTAEELDAVVAEAPRSIAVRIDLRNGAAPLRNVGPACSWCFHVAECHGLTLDIIPEEGE